MSMAIKMWIFYYFIVEWTEDDILNSDNEEYDEDPLFATHMAIVHSSLSIISPV